MYVPFNEPGELVYGYDVNSLYPSVMQNFDMPIGKPTFFNGNIRKVDLNAFGVFIVKWKLQNF